MIEIKQHVDISKLPLFSSHLANCAIHGEGPCTCGAEEFLEELVFEEAGLTEEDFQ